MLWYAVSVEVGRENVALKGFVRVSPAGRRPSMPMTAEAAMVGTRSSGSRCIAGWRV